MSAKILLERAVYHGPAAYKEATVRLPLVGADLMRAPAGMSIEEHRVRTLTDLPPEVASQLTPRDFHTIADALELLMGPDDADA